MREGESFSVVCRGHSEGCLEPRSGALACQSVTTYLRNVFQSTAWAGQGKQGYFQVTGTLKLAKHGLVRFALP